MSKPKQDQKTQAGKKSAAIWRAKEKVGVPRYSKEFLEYLKMGGRRVRGW